MRDNQTERAISGKSGRSRRTLVYATRRQIYIAGFLIPVVLLCQALAIFGGFIPSVDQLLSVNLRIFDSLAPHLLVLSVLLSLLLGLIRHRRAMILCLVLAVGGAGLLTLDYRRHLALQGETDDLTILWFNMLYENTTPPETITAALQDSGADLIILSEAAPMRTQKQALSGLYPYQLGCDDPKTCNILALSKYPFGNPRMFDLFSGPGRMARVEVTPPGKAPVTVAAIHMLKPWYLGFTEADDEFIRWQLRAVKRRALVVVGDFNAAPWSHRMRQLRKEQRLRYPRVPVATWPEGLGAFGVPIDNVLTRRGPGITSLTRWGAGLGSNHYGLLAAIDLAEAD